MKRFLRVLFAPGCWIQISSYSAEWDRELRELIKTEKFEWAMYPGTQIYTRYRARIGHHHVWVANHPYGSFMMEISGKGVRPSRATILECGDKLRADLGGGVP